MSEVPLDQNRWLDEKFNHVDTILRNIQGMVEELKSNQIRCVNRCNLEMSDLYHRLRKIEQKQAAYNGAEERQKSARQSQNITWQMIIALGTALSAIGIFIGYFLGKG